MLSSTSSSDDRLPVGGWPRAWLVAALLVVLPLAGWEAFWRARGFRPQVDAVDESWFLAMEAVPTATTVALGTSRIQAALDPEAYASTAGGDPPVSLALPGNSPIPVLEHIAERTDYAGTVLVEVLPLFVFDGTRKPEERSRELLARHTTRRVSLARRSEDWLAVHGLSHLVFRAPALLPARFASTVAGGESPLPNRIVMRPDRFGPVSMRAMRHLRGGDPDAKAAGETYPIARRAGRPATDEELDAFIVRIEEAVRPIQARGGRVVLVYMAAWGERRTIEESRYPRAKYWDRLVARTTAVAIATEDDAELSSIECPDGSHVDAEDAARYAARLGAIVRERLDALARR